MEPKLNRFVDFFSDFPSPDVAAPFRQHESVELLNPDAPQPVIGVYGGKHLAEWICAGLVERGVRTLGVTEAEYACFIRCECQGVGFELMVSPDYDGSTGRWNVVSGPELRWQDRLLGRTFEEQHRQLLLAIDESLRASDKIHGMRWFQERESPEYRDLLSPSEGPIREPGADRRDPPLIRLEYRLEGLFVWLASARGPLLCGLVTVILVASGLGLKKALGIVIVGYVVGVFVVGMLMPFAIRSYVLRTLEDRTADRDAT